MVSISHNALSGQKRPVFAGGHKAAISALDQPSEAHGTSTKTTRALYFIIRYSYLFCNKKEAMESEDSMAKMFRAACLETSYMSIISHRNSSEKSEKH